VLVVMLKTFHFALRDWGLAIICLVFIVRLCLHPVTKKSQINMMKMGKMGPEIERLKKKYADDKDELNRQMMQVYKEQGFTPVLGCLPMFLQMPIWIALWSSLQSTFELRHSPFLHFGPIKLTWINDLAKPDHLLTWGSIALPFGMHLDALNLLPILLAVVFWINQKYTPKPPATTPEQEQQQKMMQWMTLLFPLFLYNGPSGLNLYILTSTTLGIIESKIIRKHIQEQEELEKNGKVIVDASPGSRTKRVPSKVVGEEKKSGLMGKLLGAIEEAQKRAEDMRKDQDKKK
jgi:YidC/Oxa1 family membrane protein insertase